MPNPENPSNQISRAAQLTARIEELRKTRIINQSDPSYAAEIEEIITGLEEELRDLIETRH